jgi:S1-C subfamily serine protease
MIPDFHKPYRLMWRGGESSPRTIEEIRRGLARGELNTMYQVEVQGRWMPLRDFLDSLQDQVPVPTVETPPPIPQTQPWPEPDGLSMGGHGSPYPGDFQGSGVPLRTSAPSTTSPALWIGVMLLMVLISIGATYYVVTWKNSAPEASETAEVPDESSPPEVAGEDQPSGAGKLDLQQAAQRWNGDDIDDNDPAAVDVFKQHAEKGDRIGEFYYGWALYEGKGVKKDADSAVQWFKKSAAQSLSAAQFMLAVASVTGEGMPRDSVECVEWLRKAAMQAHDRAQYFLGLAYIEGEGVPKDVVKGAAWVMLASEAGWPQAQELMAEIKEIIDSETLAKVSRLVGELQSQMLSGDKLPFDPAVASNFGGQGTGFFITQDGYLVTNEHVVRQANLVKIKTSKGLITAEVVLTDPTNDLAVLKVEGTFTALPLHEGGNVALGSPVSTVGFPTVGLMGYSPKFAKGEVTSLAGIQDDERYYQISLPVQPGNSGGALVNSKGIVVGVVSAKLDMKAMLEQSNQLPENVNYAVKSALLMNLLKKLPAMKSKLLKADPKLEKPEDVIQRVEKSSVLILVK